MNNVDLSLKVQGRNCPSRLVRMVAGALCACYREPSGRIHEKWKGGKSARPGRSSSRPRAVPKVAPDAHSKCICIMVGGGQTNHITCERPCTARGSHATLVGARCGEARVRRRVRRMLSPTHILAKLNSHLVICDANQPNRVPGVASVDPRVDFRYSAPKLTAGKRGTFPGIILVTRCKNS